MKDTDHGPDGSDFVAAQTNEYGQLAEGPNIPDSLEVDESPPGVEFDRSQNIADIQTRLFLAKELVEDPELSSMMTAAERQGWIDLEERVVNIYADLPLTDELRAEIDDVLYEAFLEIKDRIAATEAKAVRVYSPEELAEMTDNTVEMYFYGDNGWSLRSERPNPDDRLLTNESIKEGTKGTFKRRKESHEDLRFSPTPNDSATINVRYDVAAVGRQGGFMTPDEIAEPFVVNNGRPGNQLVVSFDLSRDAAQMLAEQAASDPAKVREAIVAIIQGTEVGAGKSYQDLWLKKRIVPHYVPPKDGYQIGIAGGDVVGVEDYQQQLG